MRFLFGHDERGRGAIAGLRGVARGHGSGRVEDRLQFREGFERSIGARAFILIEDCFAVDGLVSGRQPFNADVSTFTGTISSLKWPCAWA